MINNSEHGDSHKHNTQTSQIQHYILSMITATKQQHTHTPPRIFRQEPEGNTKMPGV